MEREREGERVGEWEIRGKKEKVKRSRKGARRAVRRGEGGE